MVRGERVRQPERVRIGILADEAERVDLEEPGPDEHVLDEPAEALVLRQPAEHGAAERERERDALEPVDARDLLDQVDLPGDVGAPGRHGHVPAGRDVEPERVERVLLLLLGDLDAHDPVGALGAERDPRRLGQLADDVCVARPAGAGKLDQSWVASRAACGAR